MKTILEFNLPDERWELDTAMNGAKYKSILIDFDNHLRYTLKHKDLPSDVWGLYDELRKQLYTYVEEHGVILE